MTNSEDIGRLWVFNSVFTSCLASPRHSGNSESLSARARVCTWVYPMETYPSLVYSPDVEILCRHGLASGLVSPG